MSEGTSTLEQLFNKGKLSPESYPQLIRTLQRERNALREAGKTLEANYQGQVTNLTLSIAMMQRELKTLRSFITKE